MNSLEYIDDYFKGAMPPEETRTFEQKIESDPAFAEEVAFYLSATGVLKQHADAARKERFRNLQPVALVRPMRRWYIASAAAVVVVAVSVFLLFNRQPGMQQLATSYVEDELSVVGVTMGRSDSLQSARQHYNEKKFALSLAVSEALVLADPQSEDALKNAGLSALQLQQYDKALQYFSRLEQQPLRVNPGKFYRALTLMKRNGPGDEAAAKALLQQVVAQGLYGKAKAAEWLDKM
jgi:hypothetical protein